MSNSKTLIEKALKSTAFTDLDIDEINLIETTDIYE